MKRKYYIFSSLIILSLLLFLSLREYNGNYYKMSIEEAYALFLEGDYQVSSSGLQSVGQDVLKINIATGTDDTKVFSEENNQLTVPTSNLLNKTFLKRLKQHQGIIVIDIEDTGLASHVWLILTRKGIEHVKILGITENEKIRYTFQKMATNSTIE